MVAYNEPEYQVAAHHDCLLQADVGWFGQIFSAACTDGLCVTGDLASSRVRCNLHICVAQRVHGMFDHGHGLSAKGPQGCIHDVCRPRHTVLGYL